MCQGLWHARLALGPDAVTASQASAGGQCHDKSCCCAGLGSNPELVYALLHRAEVFESIRLHDRFADVLQPIQVGIQAALALDALSAML